MYNILYIFIYYIKQNGVRFKKRNGGLKTVYY